MRTPKHFLVHLAVKPSRQTRFAGLVVLLVLVMGAFAAADESTGTWTGNLRIQGNYYWETSTRVVAPEVRATLVSPDGVVISAGYLIDAITSASLAAGVIEDIRFTETRNQGSLSVGREFDLGEAQLRLNASGLVSHEPDYLATSLSLNGTLSLNQRSTLFSLGLGYIHDNVGSVLRGANSGATDPDGRMLSNRGRVGQLEGMNLSAGVTQILAPNLWVSAEYNFLLNNGLLSNPYRSVMVQGVLTPEAHPGQRTRHTISGRLAYFVEPTRTAIHLMYRSYLDDWELAAINPEVRIYQEVGDAVTLRARYRYYEQNRSFFYRNADVFTADDPFVTADPKMGAFHSHLLGFRGLVMLRFLANTPLDFLSHGTFDVSFDYLWQTSRFGNAVMAQSGLTVPF